MLVPGAMAAMFAAMVMNTPTEPAPEEIVRLLAEQEPVWTPRAEWEALERRARREGTVLFLAWYKGAGFNHERFHGTVFRACFPWTLKGDHVLASWRLLESGALTVDPLHLHQFPVAEVQRAYDLIYAAPEEYVGISLDWRG